MLIIFAGFSFLAAFAVLAEMAIFFAGLALAAFLGVAYWAAKLLHPVGFDVIVWAGSVLALLARGRL